VRQVLDQQNTQKSDCVEFAVKALVSIVLSAINAVSGFMKGVVVYLVNYRMWLFSDVRSVLIGSRLEKFVLDEGND